MIRKAIIVVLALAAVAVFYFGIVGIGHTVSWLHVLDNLGWPQEDRHYYAGKFLVWTSSDGFAKVKVRSGGGYIDVHYMRRTSPELANSGPSFYLGKRTRHPAGSWILVGNTWWHERPMDSGVFPVWMLHIGIPWWLPFLLLAAYPTIAFIRGPLRRWPRSRKGRCLKCGYDLTGNVSGTCPECGTEVKQP